MSLRSLVFAVFAVSAPSVARAADVYNVLLNVTSDRCVDVPSSSTGNVLVQQYPCNYGNNQFWRLVPTGLVNEYTIVNLHSRKCLEMPGWTFADGVHAQQYTCNGGWNQHWIRVDLGNGEYAYQNGYSGKCLDIAGGTTASGYVVNQWTCHYNNNQRFTDGDVAVSVSF